MNVIWHNLTLSSPAHYLAYDELMLESCEGGPGEELLWFWTPKEYFVVLGYANRVSTEVNVAFCESNEIQILRRCTGGGTVLQGPGCLNYSVCLRADKGRLSSITTTNDYVMLKHQNALSRLLGCGVAREGYTDLTMGGLKFCGNAQRRKARALLFHGSFLLNLDISMVERALLMPSKRPAYRGDRRHHDFLMNLNISPNAVKEVLIGAWGAVEASRGLPVPEIDLLVRDKYSRRDWNFKF
jgi:lipoate-protein ligase A